MDAPVQKKEFAWQPITPRGVASFGNARYGRLLLVHFIVAVLAAAAILWVLQKTWFRAVQEAITNLPASGEIRSARLNWDGPDTVRLAENRFLSITVDLQHKGQVRSPAHLQLEFGSKDLRATSLFGFARIRYSSDWVIAFNRPQLEPWWGAWKPPILALTAAGVIVWLLIVWTMLGLL